jgi:GTP 3',8-cyclase
MQCMNSVITTRSELEPFPVKVIKLKINGICLNSCSFCMFHENKSRLSLGDVERVFNQIQSLNIPLIVINGGEPTLHPEFEAISKFLRSRFKGKIKLQIGTNLRLFENRSPRLNNIYEAMVSTYDRISIGCDAEHKNIDIVEKTVPDLRNRGLEVSITTVEGYSDNSLLERLELLSEKYSARVRVSQVNHFSQDNNEKSLNHLCMLRRDTALIDCDGAVYFCSYQELEKQVFNIHSVPDCELNDRLFNYVPKELYKYCVDCHRYVSEIAS